MDVRVLWEGKEALGWIPLKNLEDENGKLKKNTFIDMKREGTVVIWITVINATFIFIKSVTHGSYPNHQLQVVLPSKPRFSITYWISRLYLIFKFFHQISPLNYTPVASEYIPAIVKIVFSSICDFSVHVLCFWNSQAHKCSLMVGLEEYFLLFFFE